MQDFHQHSRPALSELPNHNLLCALMASLPANVTQYAMSFLAGAALSKAWSLRRASQSYGSHCARRAVAFHRVRCAPPGGASARAARVLPAAGGHVVRAHAATATIVFDDRLVRLELTQNARAICYWRDRRATF